MQLANPENFKQFVQNKDAKRLPHQNGSKGFW